MYWDNQANTTETLLWASVSVVLQEQNPGWELQSNYVYKETIEAITSSIYGLYSTVSYTYTSPTWSATVHGVFFVLSGEGWKAYTKVFQVFHQVQYNITYPTAKNVNFETNVKQIIKH